MTFRALGTVAFIDSFPDKKKLKIIFHTGIGIKMSMAQAGLIVTCSLLLYSFFLLILREIRLKIFKGPRLCASGGHQMHWPSFLSNGII